MFLVARSPVFCSHVFFAAFGVPAGAIVVVVFFFPISFVLAFLNRIWLSFLYVSSNCLFLFLVFVAHRQVIGSASHWIVWVTFLPRIESATVVAVIVLMTFLVEGVTLYCGIGLMKHIQDRDPGKLPEKPESGFWGEWHSKAVLWERKLLRENGVKVPRSNIFLLLGISTGPIFHANIASRSCPSNWAISTLMRPSAIVVPTITWLSEMMGVGQWKVNKTNIKERTTHEAALDGRRIFNRWADE